MQKIVIIMPTYNEAKNIKRMLDELVGGEFPKIRNADMHLLVVDGNSPDGTGEIVEQAARKNSKVHLLREKEKRGLGWAYIEGMKYAMDKLEADAVMEMDADFQHPPKYVKDMVAAYLDGADYVIGSRYIPGGSIPSDWAIYRKAISFFGNLFIRIVLFQPKIHDLTTGFRLTRVGGVLDKIKLETLMEPRRFAYKVDLLYRSINLSKKTVEVPFHFAPRTEEKSKFSMEEMIATFKVAILLRLRASKRFIKFGTVGSIGYVINASGLEIFYRLGLPPSIAAALGAEMAIISNFTLNNLWTFKENKITKGVKLLSKFLQFNLTSAGAVLLQAIVVGAGTHFFGDETRQIMLIIAIGFFVVPYNYTMYNVFIWKTWKVPGLARLQKLVG